MSLLDTAGINVLSELANSESSISSENPSWDVDLYQRYISVVDTLQKYSKAIGFSVGNEVVMNVYTVDAAAFVKPAVRDIKAYIKSKGYRSQLGVGYAHRDNNETDISTNMTNYFNCGDDTNTVDFWGYNVYSWWGKMNYEDSNYSRQTQEFASCSVTVFLSEYGCNRAGEVSSAANRPFIEVKALYGPEISSIFSGGVALEYFEEDSKVREGIMVSLCFFFNVVIHF